MNSTKEGEQTGGYNSFPEYQLANPEQARAVINYEAYTTLAGLDRTHFWDEQIYGNLKKTLGVDNPAQHEGVRLYDLEKRQRYWTDTVSRTPGSTAEYAAIAAKEITILRQALLDWEKTEPEEYKKAKGLMGIIQAGKLDELEQKLLLEMLRVSIYQFPGIALSYQIRRNQQMVEEYKKSQATPPPSPQVSRSGSKAKQRLEEYLRKQREESEKS